MYFRWVRNFTIPVGAAAIIMGSLCLSLPNWQVMSNVFFSQAGVQTDLTGAYTNLGLRAYVSTSNVANTNSVSQNLQVAPFGDYGGITYVSWILGIIGMIFLGFYYVALWMNFAYCYSIDRMYFTKNEKLWFAGILPILVSAFNMTSIAYYTARANSNLPPPTTFGPITYGWCYCCFWVFGFGVVILTAIFVATLPDGDDGDEMRARRREKRRRGRGEYDPETATATTTNDTTRSTTYDETTGTASSAYYSTDR